MLNPDEVKELIRCQEEGAWHYKMADLSRIIATATDGDISWGSRGLMISKAGERQAVSAYFYRRARLIMGIEDSAGAQG